MAAPIERAKPVTQMSNTQEEAVIIRLKLASGGFGEEDERTAIQSFEQQLDQAISGIPSAELDGDEFGQGQCLIYLYGPSSNEIVEAIRPVTVSWKALRGGTITKRYGPPGSPETVLEF